MSEQTFSKKKKTIEFVPVTLNLIGKPLTPGLPSPQLTMEAIAGKGTGLAFHLIEAPEDEVEVEQIDSEEEWNGARSGYVLTQICSGKRLGNRGVDTPRQAKKWIELLGELADWNKELTEIIKSARPPLQLKALAEQVEQTRLAAIEQCLFVENFYEAG